MDKYEFNIKVEQIRKLINQGDFETAMKIADTIDWKKVRNANLLSMVANVYEKNHEYQDAKEILLMAFERAMWKRPMPTTGSSVTWREMIRASICSVT